MIYDLITNNISPGEDIKEFFYQTSPDEVSGIISDLVDHILNRDFENYWSEFSYPVPGNPADSQSHFFYEYLEYVKRVRSLQNILSPDSNDVANQLNTSI